MPAAVAVVALAFFSATQCSGVDEWSQWRGPARDGHVTGLSLPNVLPSELKPVWKVEVGEGHSSPVVGGDQVFLLSRQGENEVVRAIGLANGKEVWSQRYPAPFKMSPYAITHGKGPKSTPVVTGDRLYTLGIGGILSAWNAESGTLLWQHDFAKTFTKWSALFYGNAMSPLVDADRLIVHVGCHDEGALTALDRETGKPLWQWNGDGPGYASPIIATLAGMRQAITLSQTSCVSVSAADGSLLWRFEYKTDYDQHVITPVVAGDLVIFGGNGKPTTAYRLKESGGDWSPEQVWENKDLSMYMSSPVVVGDRLIGLSSKKKGAFVCLETASGKALWTGDGRMGEYAALLSVKGTILALTNNGELIVFKSDAKQFAPLARYVVSQKQTWAHPALVGSRILVKDETTLALWTW
jgi:outer membrane protein assembly factor BamB